MNRYEIDGDICRIFLASKVNGAMEAIIDAEDLPRVRMFHWMTSRNKNNFYVVASIGDKRGFRSQIKLHRLITSFEFDMVDHVNRNTLDNRKTNLREADQTQQNINRIFRNTKNLPSVKKSGRKWYSYIREAGVRHQLGPFATEAKAFEAVKEKSIQLYGDRSPFYVYRAGG